MRLYGGIQLGPFVLGGPLGREHTPAMYRTPGAPLRQRLVDELTWRRRRSPWLARHGAVTAQYVVFVALVTIVALIMIAQAR